MFGITLDRWLLLAFVALFVLGPERLPAAAAWLGGAVHRLRTLITDTQSQMRTDFGTELDALRAPLDELRKPLADLPSIELHRLRHPKTAVMEYLLTPTPTPSDGITTRPPVDPDAT